MLKGDIETRHEKEIHYKETITWDMKRRHEKQTLKGDIKKETLKGDTKRIH